MINFALGIVDHSAQRCMGLKSGVMGVKLPHQKPKRCSGIPSRIFMRHNDTLFEKIEKILATTEVS